MSEEKICPFMSRPGNITLRVTICDIDERNNALRFLDEMSHQNCQKERCMAWRPEKTELVKGDPHYHGMEDKTLTYPEHCVILSHNEPLWPTIQKVLPGQE